MKHLPSDKTAVFEVLISVADLLRRNVVKSESIAHKTNTFRTGDLLVSTTSPIQSIGKADSFVFVQSYRPIRIMLRQLDASGTSVLTELKTTGMFMASSEFEEVSVAIADVEERVFYCIG